MLGLKSCKALDRLEEASVRCRNFGFKRVWAAAECVIRK